MYQFLSNYESYPDESIFAMGNHTTGVNFDKKVTKTPEEIVIFSSFLNIR
jgi:hypothetical protein